MRGRAKHVGRVPRSKVCPGGEVRGQLGRLDTRGGSASWLDDGKGAEDSGRIPCRGSKMVNSELGCAVWLNDGLGGVG